MSGRRRRKARIARAWALLLAARHPGSAARRARAWIRARTEEAPRVPVCDVCGALVGWNMPRHPECRVARGSVADRHLRAAASRDALAAFYVAESELRHEEVRDPRVRKGRNGSATMRAVVALERATFPRGW